MTLNAQDRARLFLNKVGAAAIWGEGVFILSLLLAGVVIVPLIDAMLPPEPPPRGFAFGRDFGFYFIAIVASYFIACFASGVFFSNTRKNPTLLGWPISLHGILSGFIVGGVVPALIFTLFSGKIHNLGWVGLGGIPGGFAGFLGNVAGGAYHWLRARKG